MNSNESNLKTIFYGESLLNHEMDIKDLSPSLLALGEMFEEANRIVNGNRAKIVIKVKAINPGSLDIGLNVVQEISGFLDLFNNMHITGAKNLVEILILGYAGKMSLAKFLKFLKNRNIKSSKILENGNVLIILEDGEKTEISTEVRKLYESIKIRKSAEILVRPLEKDGINSIKFLKEETEVEIFKEEIMYFNVPRTEEREISDTTTEVNLQILSAVFQQDNKWRFSDGNTSFYAEVLDIDFLKNVSNNVEVFAKDDIFKVVLQRKQFIFENNLRTEYFIVKVVEHRSPFKSIEIPFNL